MSQPTKISYSISFIIPALNEEKVVEGVVREAWTTIARSIEIYEIILIDDGSTDSTGQIMETLARELGSTRVFHNKENIGLGASYRRGLSEARFDYVMMLCGDGGLPASSLPPIIERIGTADIVIPYLTNLDKIKTRLRYVISRSYTLLLNFLSGHKLHYYNGLPVHRRALLAQVTMTSSGFSIQGEILVQLLKSGYSYVQIGVLGAETTQETSIFRIRNCASVAKTILKLVKLVFMLSLYKNENKHS